MFVFLKFKIMERGQIMPLIQIISELKTCPLFIKVDSHVGEFHIDGSLNLNSRVTPITMLAVVV